MSHFTSIETQAPASSDCWMISIIREPNHGYDWYAECRQCGWHSMPYCSERTAQEVAADHIR